MSEVDTIISQISTIGFPIVAYLLVYVDLRKQIIALEKAISALAAKLP